MKGGKSWKIQDQTTSQVTIPVTTGHRLTRAVRMTRARPKVRGVTTPTTALRRESKVTTVVIANINTVAKEARLRASFYDIIKK